MTQVKNGSVVPTRPLLGALLVLGMLLGACDGENLFRDPVSSIGARDSRKPSVSIEQPDSAQRVAVGDSLLVEIDVSDDTGVASIELSGFSLRGSPALGTQTRVDRFLPKTVDLEALRPVVSDTTVLRYLIAASDSVPEDTVFVVATVRDFGGNESADTVVVRIGGPRVQIVEPKPGSQVRAGADLRVRLTAADTINRLESVRIFTTGSFIADTTLRFEQPRTTVDTIVDLTIPSSAAAGTIELRARIRNAINDSTTTPPVRLQLLPPATDTQRPTVRFRVASPTRAERNDSIAVTVVATDDIRVDSVGVTILPIHRLSTGTDTLTVVSRQVRSDSATFRVALADLGVPIPADTSTVRLEVTAFAIDATGNCATATLPNTNLSEACSSRSPVLATGTGARFEVLVVRGRTISVGSAGDRLADLTANATHLYLSNITRNRLEVVPIGSTAVSGTVSVGSRPWGLAFNSDNSLLYVANSGGTNISVVSPATGSEVDRIQTPNIKLFDVTFETARIENPNPPPDSITALFPTNVVRFDYSDRPQFIGVTANSNVIYSTVPTAAAADGTVRIHRLGQDRLEIVTDYAEERLASKVVIANADSAFFVPAEPNNLIQVCPRNRSANPALDRNLPVACYTGSIADVQQTIASIGYDTRFLYSIDIEEVGLSDTTFVAVSRDHSTVAFGEGATQNGRVMSFLDPPGQQNGPLLKFGEIRDLVGNQPTRVFGIALNANGSLGMARGNEAYFFTENLRLQGEVPTEAGTGGVDIHPDHPGINRAFVSGVEANGLAFIDVMDTFHFRRVARIFLRDPVTGPLRVIRAPDATLKIYAITANGLVALDVNANDL